MEERALHYNFQIDCRRQRFASKTLQNDSEGVEKFRHLRFCATFVLFESFWSKNVGKHSIKTKLEIQ